MIKSGAPSSLKESNENFSFNTLLYVFAIFENIKFFLTLKNNDLLGHFSSDLEDIVLLFTTKYFKIEINKEFFFFISFTNK